jgi:glycosyltransferase involved in cell wall biosynthesis
MEARVVSRLRSYARSPSAVGLESLKRAAAAERDRLSAEFAQVAGWRPDVWLTYHPYYKAPDLIGPEMARRLGVAYATVEASYAARRGHDEWAAWYEANLDALVHGQVHFVMTSRDKAGLAAFPALAARLVDLPPFIAVDEQPAAAGDRFARAVEGVSPVRLVVVAMMRVDVKLRSYHLLANALGRLVDQAWTLDIVGDGDGRHEVEDAFAVALGEAAAQRLTWHGQCDAAEVRRHLSEADVFVWPGYGEAYGLAYLEAQAAGLPVVAQRSGGIPAVVLPGRTGLLTPEGDLDAFCAALRTMIGNRRVRRAMGQAARQFVYAERTTVQAAGILRDTLTSVAG